MKTLKYSLILLVAMTAFSCSDEPILKGDDDPIHIPPPPPPPPSPRRAADVDSTAIQLNHNL